MTKNDAEKLVWMVDEVSDAGEELRDARIAEIEAIDVLARLEAELIIAGIDGKNETERKAHLLQGTSELSLNVVNARTWRIGKETIYKAAKSSLRIMELIYKVQNEDN